VDTERLIRDIVSNVMSRLEAGPNSGQVMPGSGEVSSKSNSKVIPSQKKVVCGISVRHIHLCREHVDMLFGKGHEMQILKELYQPGTYAYKETVTIVGPRLSAIQNIRVLGPLRDKTQVELAKTDCIILGIDAPVRPFAYLNR